MADDEPESDPDRAAILARRQRFIALALTGLATAACRPQVCLSVEVHEQPGAPGQDDDAKPQPCLSPPQEPEPEPEAKPQPCLSPPQPDAKPQPCLSPPQPDAKPQPCLSPPRPKQPTK
jgi:hypothetical protein